MINIFEYQNYRTYLRDYYNDQKAAKKYFSYRYFSKKAGINASAFLYYVIENKRNLTKNSILKISQAIGHNHEEAQYFENLVFFNQASTITEKTKFYNEIIETRKPVDIKQIDKERYEYFSCWYNCVIREVVTFVDFNNDFKQLGSMLVPPISSEQALSSVRLLEKLGFIEKDDNGLYHQTDSLISVKPENPDAFLIEKFQTDMLQLAIKAYDAWPKADRMSSSTTLSISRPTFELIKNKTREFRKEILELARLDDSMEQVFQLTMNMFPVSNIIYDKKD
jgi:uncharacterized protein (TIGR02147 family)